jgi:hypothetical protein
VGLRTGGDHPNDSYVEVMMQYSDVDGNWKVKKNYRGEILVCVDISRRTTLKRIYCIVCGTFAAC